MIAQIVADPRSCCTSNDKTSIPRWHAGFLKLLPAIRQQARFAFRGLQPDAREEAIQEVLANAVVAYARLVELRRSKRAFATPLTRFAVARVRSGRWVGGQQRTRDVMSSLGHKPHFVERIDCFSPTTDRWEEMAVEDRRATPAKVACLRIDFADWLASLDARKRAIALKLAEGETTSAAAVMFGVSRGRISQIRGELHDAWHRFQNEPVVAAALRMA